MHAKNFFAESARFYYTGFWSINNYMKYDILVNKLLKEASSWWGPTASDSRSTIAQTKGSKYAKSDDELVLSFAQEPNLSELAKHYDPQGIYKKPFTPERVKHDLRFLAFGNRRSDLGRLDPDAFKRVYQALAKKLGKQ